MKTSITILFLFILIAEFLVGQEYRQMNFENGVWLEEEFWKGGTTIKRQLNCHGDTIINNKIYSKLFEYKISSFPPGHYPDTSGLEYLGALLEKNNKQVVFIGKGDTVKSLIYDYNLTLGDTIRKLFYDVTITKIDSVEYCGKFHKRYIFDNSENLVEGIGYSNGLLGYRNIPDSGESFYQLICYAEPNNNLSKICSLLLNNQANAKSQESLNIYPNPAFDQIHIKSVNDINQIIIYNLAGTKLFQLCRLQNNYLEITHGLNSGVYLLVIKCRKEIHYRMISVR